MMFASSRLASLPLALLLLAASRTFSQGVTAEMEEMKRLAAEVADLRDANAAQQRKITQLQKEIESLRDAVRDSHDRATSKMADFVTREDLKKLANSIQEVDQRREADRKLILQEFEKLGKTLAQPIEKPERKPRKPEKVTESTEAEKPIEGTFYPHKVAEGERLADIVRAFNKTLASEGRPAITMDQVKRANPKMNPERIIVGREILLPIPDKKK